MDALPAGSLCGYVGAAVKKMLCPPARAAACRVMVAVILATVLVSLFGLSMFRKDMGARESTS